MFGSNVACQLAVSIYMHNNHSKISKTFLFLFLYKMLVISVGIHKMLLRLANRQDPGQTASEAVRIGSALFAYVFSS